MLKKFLPQLIVTILIVSSISMNSMTANATTTSVNKNYSGEDLYLAVVFGQGPVAEEHFKHLWSSEHFKINNSKEAIELGENIVSEMKMLDPNYFSDLQQAVYDNDYVETKKILDNGKELLIDSFENLGEKVEMDKEGNIQPDASLSVYAFAAFAAVAVLTHAVAVTFYYKAAVGGPGLDSQNSEFSDEKVVADLIEAVN